MQLFMCRCDPYSDLFPPVTAWSLNYSFEYGCVCSCARECPGVQLCVCVCVCVWRRWSVSVAPVISLLLPAPTPVLQLTCSVLGPTRSCRPATCFPPLFLLLFSPLFTVSPVLSSSWLVSAPLHTLLGLFTCSHMRPCAYYFHSLLLNSTVSLFFFAFTLSFTNTPPSLPLPQT